MDNLNQIRIFQAITQAGSFTRAAEILHLTQPGISKHVKQMEDYYGIRLFDRLGKKVALTQAGEVLLAATQEIMASMNVAEQKIEELKGLHGKVAVGASFPIGIYVLPGILAAFQKQYPAVEVKLEILLSEKIVAGVLANRLDLGLVSHDVHDKKLASREFMADELVAIAPNGHRWRLKRSIHLQELARETFIVAGQGAGTRAVVEERLKEKGIQLGKVIEFGNTEGVKRAVEEGLGVSIQSRNVVRREIAAGFLTGVALAGMDSRLVYYYLCRKDKQLSSAMEAFVALLHTHRV